MKYLILLLLLISVGSNAKEWKTDHFSLDLPESMIVETDKKRRLLAFTKSGPYSPPFLSIEFGNKIPVNEVLKNLNESLKPQGGGMVSESCPSSCKAFYFEKATKVEGKLVYMYHYLVQSPGLTFIISYTDNVSLENGREFVKNLGKQIRAKNI